MAYERGVSWRLGRPEGDERYPYLGAEGACLGGGTPLLERDGRGAWRVRPRAELERLFAIGYGEPCDLGTRMGGLTALAGALNRGEEARAAIGLVHLRLPPLPDAASGERMAKADALLKAGYNPNEPRVPAGSSTGGQWITGGGVRSSASATRHHGPGWPGKNPPGQTYTTLEQAEAAVRAAADAAVTAWHALSAHYNRDSSLPHDAVAVVTPDGAVIADPDSPTGKLMAPPRADYRQVYAAGMARRPEWRVTRDIDVYADVTTAGTYDFQRNSATRTVYPRYANASNYAVGVYMAGAGFTRERTIDLVKEFASYFSSGDAQAKRERIIWTSRGWGDAHKGLWK